MARQVSGNSLSGGSSRKDARARQAAAHTEEMERRFAAEIEASANGVRRIDGMPASAKAEAHTESPAASEIPETPAVEEVAGEAAPTSEPADAPAADEALAGGEAASAPESAEIPIDLPTVTVVDEDAASAIIARGRGRAQFCDMAVLDFASFVHPGGGYDRGSMAQEESLCASSFLYNVLDRNRDWYAENRRRNLNCNLYRNRALVVPRVRFMNGKLHAYADVLVVAAPNAGRAREEYNVDDAVLGRAMRDRIRFALALADELGHEKLVLGAWGCGVFGWDADIVAEMLREELACGGHKAREVFFAIPKVRYNDNHERFAHVFECFPERNSLSFDEARERRARNARAEADQSDDDEEDWRKYL